MWYLVFHALEQKGVNGLHCNGKAQKEANERIKNCHELGDAEMDGEEGKAKRLGSDAPPLTSLSFPFGRVWTWRPL